MKQYIVLLSTLILAQGLYIKETDFPDEIDKKIEELFGPLLKEYYELNTLIEKIKHHQESHKISSETDVPLPKVSDSDACHNLTESLKKAVALSEKITDWMNNAIQTVYLKLLDVSARCSNINPVEAIKCFKNNDNDLKDTIEAYKPIAEKFKNEVVALAKELKVEFKECFP